MSLLKYPYTNLHELNLDWLIEQLNKESPVVSVNGKQGIVTLTGQDINRVPNDPETLSGALDELDGDIGDINEKIGTTALPTTAQTLTGAIAENDTNIDSINTKIGNTTIPTTAQTLTGAVDELSGDIGDINEKIGTTALPTTATTLTGAIAEHETDIQGINKKMFQYEDTAGATIADVVLGKFNKVKDDGAGIYLLAGGWAQTDFGFSLVWVQSATRGIVIFFASGALYHGYINNSAVSHVKQATYTNVSLNMRDTMTRMNAE